MDQAQTDRNTHKLPICLMFQDEAGFGRMSDPRDCRAPNGFRPAVKSALVREHRYVFGAVCPETGHPDYTAAENMKTAGLSLFLKQVSKAHGNHFIIMAADGASAHKPSNLVIPENVSIIALPSYSPELNSAGTVWNILRRDYTADKYFETPGEAVDET
ncbi:MAG: transposase [Deltaproteobacteria bacterium]|jgi:hypothetical protein|nr:transposase [Deltaproteobacteria bacterium]